MAIQENYITGDDSASASDSTYRQGQNFTALESYTLSQVKFLGYRHNTGETITAAIYATTEDGFPTGAALSTGSMSTDAMTTSTAGLWYTITMSSYSIVGGVQYCLIIYCSTGDYFHWRKDTTALDFYGGFYVYSADSGASWSSPIEQDFMFEIHSSATAADSVVIGELWNETRDSEVVLRLAATRLRSQGFTPQSTYTLNKVRLRIRRAAAATGIATCSLYAADGAGKPTGSVLDSGTFDISTALSTTGGSMEDFTSWSGYSLSSGVEYCLVLETDATADNACYAVRTTGRVSYDNGQYTYSTDGGSTWIPSAAEIFFEIWYTVSGVTYELDGALGGTGGIDIDGQPEVTFQLGYGAGNEAQVGGVGGISTLGVGVSSIYPQGILMVPLPVVTVKHPNAEADDDYDTKFPSIKAYTLAQPLLGGSTEATPDTYVPEEFDGIEYITTDPDTWWDRVHLVPRIVQDLGNIVSEQVFNAELYNSDMQDTITISSVTNNLAAGVFIVGVPATPFDLAPRENVYATITVSTTGSLMVDGTYTFNQSTGETYTITMTGSRIILFPIRPEAPMREHLVFDTKILTASDGSEQRIANRKAPRSVFDMTIKDDRRRMELLLMDRQAKMCATPAWHEPSFVTTAVTIGDYTVNVNSTDYANFYAGGYAIVYTDQFTYDALEIDSLTATSLTFTTPVTFDYALKTQVMPLMVAYFNHSVAASKNLNNVQTFNVSMTVDATDRDIASAAAFDTHNGKVFLSDPNLVEGGQLSEVIEKKVIVLDNITGIFEEYSQWDRSKRKSNKGFKTNTRQELWELRQLLHYLKGQQVSFYIPTFSKDLLPNTKLLNASTNFTMDNIGYTVNARGRAPKDYFRMLLVDGTELTRNVVGYAEVDSAVEQLTVDVAWPYDIEVEDIDRIDFLEKVRINVDDIVITHYNALGESKTVLPTKEVFD